MHQLAIIAMLSSAIADDAGASYTEEDPIMRSQTSYTVMGLAFAQAYTFRIQTAEGSRVSVGVTTEITTGQESLAFVQSLTTTTATATATATDSGVSVTLSWQNPSDANYETIVVSGNAPRPNSALVDFFNPVTLANTATTHTFSNLNYFTDYTFCE